MISCFNIMLLCISILSVSPPTNILEWHSGFTDMAEEYGADQVIYVHGQSRSRDVSTEWSIAWYP